MSILINRIIRTSYLVRAAKKGASSNGGDASRVGIIKEKNTNSTK